LAAVEKTMYLPMEILLFGFLCSLASAFTGAYSRKWGERAGSLLTVLLRDVLGIPVWGLGFALAALASSPLLFPQTALSTVSGWMLIAVGASIIVAALTTIRRRAAAPTARDSLAETGLYARVRHPIHCGTILEFLGLTLLRPSSAIALSCALGLVWILLQTRFEEWDLLRRIPGYGEYMKRVPRLVPRLRGP
jgi:protein-S-isoprenylcysteine O-methyltransferase Ste14